MPRMVSADDPRVALILGMVANANGARLPIDLASAATRYGRIEMARLLLAKLDDYGMRSGDAAVARRETREEFLVLMAGRSTTGGVPVSAERAHVMAEFWRDKRGPDAVGVKSRTVVTVTSEWKDEA